MSIRLVHLKSFVLNLHEILLRNWNLRLHPFTGFNRSAFIGVTETNPGFRWLEPTGPARAGPPHRFGGPLIPNPLRPSDLCRCLPQPHPGVAPLVLARGWLGAGYVLPWGAFPMGAHSHPQGTP